MQNGTILQFFHWYYPNDGSLWKKIKEEVSKLAEMGITALWLPPAYKGTNGTYSIGYDVYDIYDLGEFDQKNSVRTKYGTKQEYIEASKNPPVPGESWTSYYSDYRLIALVTGSHGVYTMPTPWARVVDDLGNGKNNVSQTAFEAVVSSENCEHLLNGGKDH